MVPDLPTTVVALAALIWTGWQEVRMWKMCRDCPFYLDSTRDATKE